MDGVLQLGLLFAAGGGILGGVWASVREHDRALNGVLESMIAAVASAAVAERFVPLNQVWTCAAAGVFVGILTGHALETVMTLAPNVLRSFLSRQAERLTGAKSDADK